MDEGRRAGRASHSPTPYPPKKFQATKGAGYWRAWAEDPRTHPGFVHGRVMTGGSR